jgi:hypothetical protein
MPSANFRNLPQLLKWRHGATFSYLVRFISKFVEHFAFDTGIRVSSFSFDHKVTPSLALDPCFALIAVPRAIIQFSWNFGSRCSFLRAFQRRVAIDCISRGSFKISIFVLFCVIWPCGRFFLPKMKEIRSQMSSLFTKKVLRKCQFRSCLAW